MSEINRIQGPGGADPGGRRDRSGNIDDDKFRKIMKVEEVHEVDPREKRKGKRTEETEDEAEGLKKASGASPDKKKVKRIANDDASPLARKKPTSKAKPSTTPPSSSSTHTPLAAFHPSEIQPYAWEEEANAPSAVPIPGANKTSSSPGSLSETSSKSIQSPTEKADRKTLATSNQEAAAPPSPPPLTHEPQLHFETESDFREEATPKEAEATPALNAEPGISEEWPQTTLYRPEPEPRITEKTPSSPSTHATPTSAEHEAPSQPATKKPAAKKASSELPGLPGKANKKEGLSFAEHMKETPETTNQNKKLSPEEQAKLKDPNNAPLPSEQGKTLPTSLPGISRQDTGFTSLKKTSTTTISSEKTGEPEQVTQEGQIPLTTAAPQTGTDLGGSRQNQDEEKIRRRETEEIEPLSTPVMGAPTTPPTVTTPVQVPVPAPYSQMEPQILALFERMVGVMTIIQTTGISETVMTLNARQFASSVLYGSQIVIREFSTAPKAFNVEFIGSPEALAQVQRNVPALIGAIQQGNYPFTINRFDTKLGSTEKPIFSRKESVQENTDQDMHENEKDQEAP